MEHYFGYNTMRMIRKDIQGLRAIAVMAVVLFHFWPNYLSGGYVGVDVFFVISGFLITSHLLRKPPVTKKALVDFWARRVKRLIPAATVVLFATVLAALAWLPETMIQRTLHEAAAAAIYGENWMLAWQATDYLASTDAPSPIQHYWSLSIEEQYYVVWPLIIGGVFLLGRRFLNTGKLLVAMMGLVFSLSLFYSVYLTATDAAAAYFVTPTRVWELTIGGIVALLATRLTVPARLAAPMAWLGLVMIAATVMLFTKQTPFPGYTALLPTIGTALVILAATDTVKWSPRRLLSWRPAQFMGDISYSVYLWHWPVVVIAPFALGVESLIWWQKLLFIIAVTCLAYLTKICVEDPVRHSRALMRTTARTYAYGAASILIVIGLSMGIVGMSQMQASAMQHRLQEALKNDPCIGAASMRDDSCKKANTELLMTPAMAKEDKAVLYEDDCWTGRPFDARKVCTYGKKDSRTRIALVGNSHAGMWHAALEEIATKNGWRLDTYLISQCYTMMLPIVFETQTQTEGCQEWNKWAVQEAVNGKYDTVVLSNRTYEKLQNVAESQQYGKQVGGYTKTLNTLVAGGLKVLAIRDAPEGIEHIPDCLAENDNDGAKCAGERAKVLKKDPLYQAARMHTSSSVEALDLSNRFCDATTCHVVIGGLIAYFDYGHVSNTYAKTLALDVRAPLEALLY